MNDIDFKKVAQVVLLLGRPNSGKSVAIRYLVVKNSLPPRSIFQFGICFTRTKFNSDYAFLPKEAVISGYDEEVLKTYLEGLEKVKEHGKKVPPNFVIFDDLMGLLSKNDPFLINFFGTHRHTNTSIFLATQHLKSGANTSLSEVMIKAIVF